MSTQPSKVKLNDEELVALKQKCISLYVDAVIMKHMDINSSNHTKENNEEE